MGYWIRRIIHFCSKTFQSPFRSDRKIFFLDLKENARGRFVKVTEDVRGRRDTIMLPIEALDEFLESLNRVVDFEGELEAHPSKNEDQ